MMPTYEDVLMQRVMELGDGARRSLSAVGYVNSIAIYNVDGTERAVMFEVARVADSSLRQRHPELVEMTAELLGMSVDALVGVMTAPEATKATGDHLTRMLVWRLRRLRPRYCLFLFEAFILKAVDPATAALVKRLVRERRLGEHPGREEVVMAVGLDPLRCLAHIIPISRTPNGIVVGETMVRDSLKGGGHISGLFGAVYLPCQS